MFFKTPPKKILAQKNVRFFSFFFNRSKEANRMIGSNFTRPPFSSACNALWGDEVIWLLTMAACTQFWCFYWKHEASCRDLQKRSWYLFSFISLTLTTLPTKKLKKNPWIQGNKKFRNFNLRALKVNWQILLGVFVKDEQSCQVKLNVYAVKNSPLTKLVEGLLLFTGYFFKTHFLIFLFRWRARNYKSPWCINKTTVVVWSLLVILGFLITKLSWSIYRLFDPNKLCYFTVKPFGSLSPKHLYSQREKRVMFMKFYGKQKSTSLGKSPFQSQT